VDTLQARLLAARAVRAAQEQEDFARQLRPADALPRQRSAERPMPPAQPGALHVVPAPPA
jgi:hypothetical protein